MKKINISDFLSDIFRSSKVLLFLLLCLTSGLATIILASSYGFQNIVENGVSKRDIIAKNNIEVVDVKKTEFLKQEAANKVRPILVPIDDAYVKQGLDTLLDVIENKRNENKNFEDKVKDLSADFDISDLELERQVINYLLAVKQSTFNDLNANVRTVLEDVLKTGVFDTDFDNDNVMILLQKKFYNMIPRSQYKAISVIIEQVIAPNLIIDEHATESARISRKNAVPSRTVTFKKDDYILRQGEPVNQLKRDALKKAGYTVLELNKGSITGMFLLIFLTLTLVTIYIKNYEKRFYNFRYGIMQMSLALFVTALTVVISHYDYEFSNTFYFVLLPAYTIILGIFTSPVLACLSSILLLLLFSVVLNLDQQMILSLIFTTVVASYSVSHINYSGRSDLVKCGLYAACMAFFSSVLIHVFNWQFDTIKWTQILFATLGAFISSIIALGSLPIIEKASKILTPYGLIELAEHSQKLLATLQNKAPGTFNHSLAVANLCEAAAEAIGADPILARVGAYYHDIGKLKRPFFFIENQSYYGVENPHEKYGPRLSKMVIISHTLDGVEIAKQYGLPQSVINFIQQHHGESLAGHFYAQAVQQEGAENVDKEQFRYPGPKPNTKETAILMLADAVESALRSLKNPSQDEISNMINKIFTERLNDGQLGDSPLTLKDIKTIANTFIRIARGMFHDRIKYQENGINELVSKNQIHISNVQSDEEKIEKKIQKKREENLNEKENGEQN